MFQGFVILKVYGTSMKILVTTKVITMLLWDMNLYSKSQSSLTNYLNILQWQELVPDILLL